MFNVSDDSNYMCYYTGSFNKDRKSGRNGKETCISKENYQGLKKLVDTHDYQMTKQKGYEQYTGDFKDGVYHGMGQFWEKDNEMYEGMFHQGKRHWFGILRKPDGRVYLGGWKEGTPEGEGIFINENLVKWEGNMKEGKADGIGMITIGKEGPKMKGFLEDAVNMN